VGLSIIQAQEEIRDEVSSEPFKQIRNTPLNELFPGMKDQAIVLDINARVVEQNKEEIWQESHQRTTITGHPVSINLVGSNVVVAMKFVPYLRRRGHHILVAQGQIWVDNPSQGISYHTTFQTIPLNFEETIYIFPLGQSNQINESRIEIMLTMHSYKKTDSEQSEETTPENMEHDN